MVSTRARRWYIALITVLALYTAYRYTLHRMIESKLDEIRKQGYPATLAELDKWYVRPPQGENAGDVFQQAFSLLTADSSRDLVELLSPGELTKMIGAPQNKEETAKAKLPIVGFVKMPPRTEPLPVETVNLAEAYLARKQEAFVLLHKAAAMEQCRYPIDLTKPEELLHLGDLRATARNLELEAIIQAERGERDAAVQTLSDSIRFAHTISGEPLLISQLVRFACCTMNMNGLERVLNRITMTDDQLRRLSIEIEGGEDPRALRLALVGDRSFHADYSLHTIVMRRDFWAVVHRKPPLVETLWLRFCDVSGVLELSLIHYLDAVDKYIVAAQTPFPSRLESFKALDIQTRSRNQYGKIVVKEARCIALLRTAQAALGMERYRLAHGKLSDSLSDLLPEHLAAVPIDPFDGQPLRYKRLAKGYVVYSVGEDGKDDGGDEKKDITFTVER